MFGNEKLSGKLSMSLFFFFWFQSVSLIPDSGVSDITKFLGFRGKKMIFYLAFARYYIYRTF